MKFYMAIQSFDSGYTESTYIYWVENLDLKLKQKNNSLAPEDFILLDFYLHIFQKMNINRLYADT